MLAIQPKSRTWLPTIVTVRIWYKHRWRQILRPKVKWLPKVALFRRFSSRSRREKFQELCSRLGKAKIGIESVKQRQPRPSKWLEWQIQQWLFCREQYRRWINHPNLEENLKNYEFQIIYKVLNQTYLLLFTNVNKRRRRTDTPRTRISSNWRSYLIGLKFAESVNNDNSLSHSVTVTRTTDVRATSLMLI